LPHFGPAALHHTPHRVLGTLLMRCEFPTFSLPLSFTNIQNLSFRTQF
jgi:hypothetical protein